MKRSLLNYDVLVSFCLLFTCTSGQVQSMGGTSMPAQHFQSGSMNSFPPPLLLAQQHHHQQQQQQQGNKENTHPKSPLLHSIFSRIDGNATKGASDPSSDLPQTKRVEFLDSLLNHLHSRRDQNIPPFQSRNLFLTINDGSAQTVNIEFNGDGEDEPWNAILELLADSLAYVIEEAERQGYSSQFKYSISLSRPTGFSFGPALSVNALKSAAG